MPSCLLPVTKSSVSTHKASIFWKITTVIHHSTDLIHSVITVETLYLSSCFVSPVSKRDAGVEQSCKPSFKRERAEDVPRQQHSDGRLYCTISRCSLFIEGESGLFDRMTVSWLRQNGEFNLCAYKIDPSGLPFRFAPSQLGFHHDPCCARTAVRK